MMLSEVFSHHKKTLPCVLVYSIKIDADSIGCISASSEAADIQI